MVPAPEVAPVMSGGLDALLAAVAPWATATATVTFLDRADTVARSYPGPDVVRLRLLKELVDPDGVIHSNRPVLDAPVAVGPVTAVVAEIYEVRGRRVGMATRRPRAATPTGRSRRTTG